MPGYLDNTEQIQGIRSMGETMNSMAFALPQLRMQAARFRQQMALQRAQELLNQQRGQESQARSRLYEAEQTRNVAQTDEVKARTKHVKGQEEREQNIATAAIMMGQALARRQAGMDSPGGMGPFTKQQDATQQAIQAAALLSARDPALMGRFMNELNPQQKNQTVNPGQVLVSPQGQPLYTNMQQRAVEPAAPRVVSPNSVVFDPQSQAPVYTNMNARATGGTGARVSTAGQDVLSRMRTGQGKAAPLPSDEELIQVTNPKGAKVRIRKTQLKDALSQGYTQDASPN